MARKKRAAHNGEEPLQAEALLALCRLRTSWTQSTFTGDGQESRVNTGRNQRSEKSGTRCRQVLPSPPSSDNLGLSPPRPGPHAYWRGYPVADNRNLLVYRHLKELYILNECFAPLYSVEGIPRFFYTKNIEIIALDGFCWASNRQVCCTWVLWRPLCRSSYSHSTIRASPPPGVGAWPG